ncbi:hypothetical protein BH09PSE6_BH09PSE6_03380 [soil metagenome]
MPICPLDFAGFRVVRRAAALTAALALAFACANAGAAGGAADPYRPLSVIDARMARSDQGVQAEIAQRLDEARRRGDDKAVLIALRDQVLAYGIDPLPNDRQALVDAALAVSREARDDETTCVLSGQSGAALAMAGDESNSDRAFDEAAAMCEAGGYRYALATVYLARGNAEYDRNRGPESLGWLEKAYRLFEQQHAVEQMSQALTFIAAAIRMPETATTEDLAKAVEYLTRARDMLDPARHKVLILSAMHDLGLTYQRQHEPARARAEWTAALAMATSAASPFNVALLEFRLGTIDLDEGSAAQAKALFERALPEFEKREGQQLFSTLTYLKLGKAEAHLKHRDAAYAALREGCDQAQHFGWPRIVGECLSTTSDVDAAFGDFRSAHQALQQLVAIERGSRQRTQMAELEELKVRFDMKLKSAENALLKAREAESENRRTALVLMLLLAIVVMVFGIGFLVTQLRQKHRFAMLAMLDELTGAPNRRSMTQLIEREFGDLTSRVPLWVAIIDVDHFKGINDTHGHDVGDTVLREIYRVCKEALRPEDTIGRWGGEEFLLVTREPDGFAIHAMFARLLQAVGTISVPQLPAWQPISFSMGACQQSDEIGSIDDLLRLADNALYRAKDAGRARCEIAAVRAAAWRPHETQQDDRYEDDPITQTAAMMPSQ